MWCVGVIMSVSKTPTRGSSFQSVLFIYCFWWGLNGFMKIYAAGLRFYIPGFFQRWSRKIIVNEPEWLSDARVPWFKQILLVFFFFFTLFLFVFWSLKKHRCTQIHPCLIIRQFLLNSSECLAVVSGGQTCDRRPSRSVSAALAPSKNLHIW